MIKREKLLSLRLKRKQTQRSLAKEAGVAFATVQRAEYTGKISVVSLEKIAAALKVNPAYFFK